jgi:hypothetical protein
MVLAQEAGYRFSVMLLSTHPRIYGSFARVQKPNQLENHHLGSSGG